MTGRKIGYARVSTQGQDLETQVKMLTDAGVEPRDIYTETASGRKSNRPELRNALRATRTGDTLIVTKLDRIARSTKDLLNIVADLEERGVGFSVVTQPELDTNTPAGRLFLTIVAAVAEMEADLVSERTREALAARPPGQRGGRPHVLTPAKLELAQRLYDEDELTMPQIAESLGVGTTTLYKYLTLKGNDGPRFTL